MEVLEKEIFNRSQLLLGAEKMDVIRSKKVIIFGVGGVGSWCAESLVRNGIYNLTIVDSDMVCVTNCNRQLMATTKTIGEVKVDALRSRLLDINPYANIIALQKVYNAETSDEFHLEEYDFIIDCIDSLKDKAHLILTATRISHDNGRTKFFSSMGAALRIDPLMIRVAEFWKVKNDPLGKAIRKKFKHNKQNPSCKFQCVYSEELPMDNLGQTMASDVAANPNKAQINGSLSHITGIFGMTLAGLVMKEIVG